MENEHWIHKVREAVTERQGIKSVELVAYLGEKFNELPENLSEIIDGAVERGMIIEIEYTVPTQPGKAKSFYLPKESTLNLKVGCVNDNRTDCCGG